MTKRRRISARDRAALFEREKGACHLCKGLVQVGQAWDVSHDIPLACGGADDDTNWKVAHRKCHKTHTATVDAPMIAKVRRQGQTHVGASVPKGDIPQRAKPDKPPPRPLANGMSEIARRYQLAKEEVS